MEPLLAHSDWDGPRTIALIRSTKYSGRFPNLKGPKIAPLWIRMLVDEWKGHPIYNINQIGLPVDIHTGAATVMLGGVHGSYQGDFASFRDAVQQVWREASEGTEHYPLQVDEPLWHLSRNSCRKMKSMPCEYRHECDLAAFCTGTRLMTQGNATRDSFEVQFETGRW